MDHTKNAGIYFDHSNWNISNQVIFMQQFIEIIDLKEGKGEWIL